MGKSQTKRLREATKRFGRENWRQWYNARAELSFLVYTRKVEAGLIAPTVIGSVSTGQVIIKSYSTYLSYQQNEVIYGRPLK